MNPVIGMKCPKCNTPMQEIENPERMFKKEKCPIPKCGYKMGWTEFFKRLDTAENAENNASPQEMGWSL